jgi:hypothetical protein
MKQEKAKKTQASVEPKSLIDKQDFAFGKQNYRWLLIALGFLVVGFILMIGGGSDDPNVFNYGMFNFQRLTLSPILLMIGYGLGIYAIMKKPKDAN